MLQLHTLIKKLRTEHGLTQAKLSQLSKISLPSIQNIERGLGNPEWNTITALLDALELEPQFISKKPDWELLATLGTPITSAQKTSHKFKNIHPTADLLLSELKKAAQELQQNPHVFLSERKTEALQSLLLSIKSHFPTFFKKNIASSPLLMELDPKKITGKMIKLKRIALTKLATYL